MFTKNSRNRYDKKDSLELGQKAESLFAKSAIKHGWTIEPASEDSNKNEHFDYIMSKEGRSLNVEVKSSSAWDAETQTFRMNMSG